MNKYLFFIVLFVLMNSGISVVDANAVSRSAKVTLVVLDEEGLPLEGIDVGVGFEKNKRGGTETTAQRGLTDSEGHFTATGRCNGHIGYGARKKGYYRTHHDYDFSEFSAFGWQPWNPELKLVMRKIGNPVPMYARKVKIDLPVLGKNIGFDLTAYDFVQPYGRGSHSDLIFHASKNIEDKRNYQAHLNVLFSNKFDGILYYKENGLSGSEFKLPRFAPLDGYLGNWEIAKIRTSKAGVKVSFLKEDNFILRIRSEEKDGKFDRAIYGKIVGPISFGNITKQDTVTIIFKYYLNPDYTRNLEFDPNRNLFSNLPPLEQVGIK